MTAILLFHHICGKRLHPCFVTRIESSFNFPCSVTNDYTFHGGHLLLSHTGVSLPGKSGRHVIMLNKKPILSLMYPGWKLELNADANPGRTGDDDGTPAAAAAAAATAAACSGATEATDDTEDPGSPMKEDNTGLPAPGQTQTNRHRQTDTDKQTEFIEIPKIYKNKSTKNIRPTTWILKLINVLL